MSRVIWLTGLPGSGKTSIAERLHSHFSDAVHLDGDKVRKGLSSDLGFSIEERDENIRRIAEMAKLLLDQGKTVIVSVISPTHSERAQAKAIIGSAFFEVFVDAPLEVCKARDAKGMYRLAEKGAIDNFTGISSVYEPPASADIHIKTAELSIDACIFRLMAALQSPSFHEPHLAFIGRWCPFHKGHAALIFKAREMQPQAPILILVRHTAFDFYHALYRKQMVECGLKALNLAATVQIIPDISTLNWGRDVGYKPQFIEVDGNAKGISATEIRQKMQAGDCSWRDLVCPGVAEFIERNGI